MRLRAERAPKHQFHYNYPQKPGYLRTGDYRMLKPRHAALAVVLLLAAIGDSWSQSQELPTQNSQGVQHQPDAQQRGTEQSPFIIKIMPASEAQEKSGAGTKQGPDEEDDAWSVSDRIAAIASIAALLQFIALVATFWIMVQNGRRQLRAYVFLENAGIVDGTMMNPPNPAHANEPGVLLKFSEK